MLQEYTNQGNEEVTLIDVLERKNDVAVIDTSELIQKLLTDPKIAPLMRLAVAVQNLEREQKNQATEIGQLKALIPKDVEGFVKAHLHQFISLLLAYSYYRKNLERNGKLNWKDRGKFKNSLKVFTTKHGIDSDDYLNLLLDYLKELDKTLS